MAADFKAEVETYLNHTVNTISVGDAFKNIDMYVFLDARELEEFKLSHIPNAKYVGFDDFEYSSVEDIPKDCPIVVYCSIGYRSEKVGEKLRKLGFENIQNLYGSIFEWVNQGLPLEDKNKKLTSEIHTYNKRWSKWVTNDGYNKVW